MRYYVRKAEGDRSFRVSSTLICKYERDIGCFLYLAPFDFSFVLFTDINECVSNPCENGGTCQDAVNHYTCDCVTGYTGEECETGRVNILMLSVSIFYINIKKFLFLSTK